MLSTCSYGPVLRRSAAAAASESYAQISAAISDEPVLTDGFATLFVSSNRL